MPIADCRLNRREFLLRSCAALAGLMVAPMASARPASVHPHRWGLFSDTHIAADLEAMARGVKMSEHLERAVSAVLAMPVRPAGVFVNGDCAYNSGLLTDYVRFMQLVQPLSEARVPLHVAMGNHDDRSKLLSAARGGLGGARYPVQDRHVVCVKSERVNWFVLDSLEKTLSTPGWLGPEQLEWLAGALDANRKKPAIVMAHHNPALTGNSGLKDTAALFEVLRPRKQVKAYVFGHTHTWLTETEDSGLHLVNLPPVAYVFKDGDPSGWVMAEVFKDRMALELKTVGGAGPERPDIRVLRWREA